MGDVDSVDFATEESARGTLQTLNSMLDNLGVVTVADFCEIVGSISEFENDDTIGWRSFAGAEIAKNTIGWSLRLPDPIEL